MKRPTLGGASTPVSRPVAALAGPMGVPARRPVAGPRMARPGVDGPEVKYYVGDEVTFTPHFGHATLFVVGMQPSQEIAGIAKVSKSYHKKVNHIYLGANRSCKTPEKWHVLVKKLLARGYYVSLEIDITAISRIEDWQELDNSYFCPVIRWCIPNVLNFRNGALKIDDEGFNKTNDGVWTRALIQITTPEGLDFSPWAWFGKDTVIK